MMIYLKRYLHRQVHTQLDSPRHGQSTQKLTFRSGAHAYDIVLGGPPPVLTKLLLLFTLVQLQMS